METPFSGLSGLLPAYSRLLEVFLGAPFPENISAHRLQRGFRSMVFSIKDFSLAIDG